jgi:hypothetical protein
MSTGKHCPVNDFLMGPGNVVKFMRECNSKKEIMGGQKALHLLIQPFLRLILLTGGAMPVPAAAWNRLSGITVITGINDGPEGTASAITDIPDDLFMYPGHSFSIKFQILSAIDPENLLNGAHDNTPCIT